MDRLQTTFGATSDSQETEKCPIPIHSSSIQLSFDGIGNVALPDLTNPLNATSLPTPGTWVEQQLGIGALLDLKTPSLDDIHNAGMDWNSSMATVNPSSLTATPEIPTPAPAHQSMSSGAMLPPQEPLLQPHKLMGSSTAFPVPLRIHTVDLRPSSSSFQRTQYSVITQCSSGPELRSTQSAVNLSMSYEGLPERPHSSEGKRSKRGSDPVNERSSNEGEDGQEDDKLKLNRERNRLAAVKTRRKKKRSAKETEERAKEIEDTNARLHQEVRALRDAFSTLRYCALSHDPAAGCTCVDIHQYNERMAKEVAKEVAKRA